jgi:PleD family two-component response regulator
MHHGKPTHEPIRVLIVDDERTVRRSLELALRHEEDLRSSTSP